VTEPARPYADAAPIYFAAGWAGALPVRGKYPPPKGWTGQDAPYPSYPDVQAWCDEHGDLNIGLRLPRHVLGIDVDNYVGKPGKATLEAAETRWGALPVTWVSTSRSDGVSGIRLYSVPEGLAWPGELPGGGVELIQYRHRYVMAWPSIHPTTGDMYRWHIQRPHFENAIPAVDDLPALPAEWIKGLTLGDEKDVRKANLADGEAGAWLTAHGDGQPCQLMQAATQRGKADLGTPGSRHESATRAVARVCHLIAEGHTGGMSAAVELAGAFAAATAAEPERAGEFGRLLTGAVRMAAVSTRATLDPCDLGAFSPMKPVQFDRAPAVPHHGPESTPADVAIVDEPIRSSWSPVDLTAILEGRNTERAPDVLRREDGNALFYLGRVNGLLGPSESGKSWVALEACKQVLADGDHVVFLDFEDTAQGTVARLKAMGVDLDAIRARFHYIGPDEAPTSQPMSDLMNTLDLYRPRLVILDGFNAAMSLSGLDLMSNTDATRFYQGLLKPITAEDRAVVYVDHTPKSKEDESQGGIGAQAKRAMTSGCAIRVDKRKDFGPGVTGYLKLIVDKDRAGLVREIAAGARNIGTAVIRSEHGGPVSIVIEKPEQTQVSPNGGTVNMGLGVMMEHVSTVLQRIGPTNRGVLASEVGRRKDDVRDATDQLAKAGYVSIKAKGPGVVITLLRPFVLGKHDPFDFRPASTPIDPGSNANASENPSTPPTPPIGGPGRRVEAEPPAQTPNSDDIDPGERVDSTPDLKWTPDGLINTRTGEIVSRRV
jgi:hypothetical protein